MYTYMLHTYTLTCLHLYAQYVYTHSLKYTYIKTNIHIYIHTYINTYIHTAISDLHLFKYTYSNVTVCPLVVQESYLCNTYIHTYIHTYVHTYIHTYTYIHTHIHTYIHTLGSGGIGFDIRHPEVRPCPILPLRRDRPSPGCQLSDRSGQAHTETGFHMYVCMYVCIYICMYLYIYVCTMKT